MGRADSLMLFSFLKSGNTQAANSFIQSSSNAMALERLQSLPADLFASFSEDDFVCWSEAGFAGHAMPKIPLKTYSGRFTDGSSCLHSGK